MGGAPPDNIPYIVNSNAAQAKTSEPKDRLGDIGVKTPLRSLENDLRSTWLGPGLVLETLLTDHMGAPIKSWNNKEHMGGLLHVTLFVCRQYALQKGLPPCSLAVLLAPTCSHCGRPRPLSATIIQNDFPPPSPPVLSQTSTCCWWTPPGSPLTANHASSSTVSFAGKPLLGVLPTSLLRTRSCSPPPLPPTLPPGASQFQACYPASPLSQRLIDQPQPPPLRILSVNCGSLSTKQPRLLSLVDYVDPDIICLQEIGPLPGDVLTGLPFRSWWGPPVPGGGLVTFIHLRHCTPATKPTTVTAQPHYLIISLPLSPTFALTVANVHLPPGLPSAHRVSHCVAIGTAIASTPRGLHLIVGDLNDSLPPTQGEKDLFTLRRRVCSPIRGSVKEWESL
jgi:hypothetical protein